MACRVSCRVDACGCRGASGNDLARSARMRVRCIIQTTDPPRGILELPFTDAICSSRRLPRDRLNCRLNERFGRGRRRNPRRFARLSRDSADKVHGVLGAGKNRIYHAKRAPETNELTIPSTLSLPHPLLRGLSVI